MADKKKEGKPKKTSKKWKLYTIEGNKAKKQNKSCPKCGDGVFLAKHKDRLSCGKCGYMESLASAKKENPPTSEEKKE